MTETLRFGWTYSDARNYVVTEFLQDGNGPVWTREIDPANYKPYLEWTAVGNTPIQIAGNKYVTFPSGVPTYDSDGAAKEKLGLEWDMLVSQINYQLDDTTWYMLSDSQLTAIQVSIVSVWRKSMMEIPSIYKVLSDAQVAYDKLVDTKPPYNIRAP
jgi:hypothetical protein